MVLFFRRDVFGFKPPQVAGANSPSMTAVCIDADTPLIPPHDLAFDSSAIFGLEPHAFTNAKVDHGDLSAQLLDHPKSLNDFPIKGNQLFFVQAIQIDLRRHNLIVHRDWHPALNRQKFVDSLIRPGRQILKNVFKPFIRVEAIQYRGAQKGLDNRSAFSRAL